MNPATSIQIELPSDTLAKIGHLKKVGEELPAAIARGMDVATEKTLLNIREDRLSGQGPFPVENHRLGVRSGKLRQSSYRTKAVVSGAEISTSIGSPLRYARVHEFGFQGEVAVQEFRRKNERKSVFSKEVRTSKKTGRRYKANVKTEQGYSLVRAHRRTLHVGARAPFGHGVADNAELFPAAINSEVQKLWEAQP